MSVTAPASNGTTTSVASLPNGASAKSAAAPSEVGWLFVTQYYTSLNNDPSKLHCYYSKRSTFLHGVEQEEGAPLCFGQQQIHDRIVSLGFQNAKVFVSNVDSQASASGGIIIQVLGEMSNDGGIWKKFAQTFFLAEQPQGFFVLNDIFRYLKDEEEIEEEAEAVDDALKTELEDAEDKGVDVPHQIELAPGQQLTNQILESNHVAALPAPSEATPATPATRAQEPSGPSQSVLAADSNQITEVDNPPSVLQQPKETAKPEPAPAGPKTWANLAASNATKWGTAVSAEARGVSSAREKASAPTQQSTQPSNGPARSPKVDTHVFIKNVVTEQMPSEGLQAVLEAKFGPMKECHIVPAKACAFGEFTSPDAAKKAIQAGQVKVGASGWTITIEEKRKQNDRPQASRGARGGSNSASQGASRGRGGARGSRN